MLQLESWTDVTHLRVCVCARARICVLSRYASACLLSKCKHLWASWLQLDFVFCFVLFLNETPLGFSLASSKSETTRKERVRNANPRNQPPTLHAIK